MKAKYYFMMVASAILLSNCSQEEATEALQNNTQTLTATIEGSSRSAVTDAGVFSWSEGDAISVWNGTKLVTYTNASGNSFSTTDEAAGTPTGYAIYPAGNHNVSGSSVSVNLPTTYGDENAEYQKNTNAPMLATITSGNNTLAFKHLGGVMRFIVKDVPASATSFTFTANLGITGNFNVTESEGNNIITATTATETNKTVTINFKAGTEARTMTFYVPLPTGTYGDYTVAIGGKSHTSTSVSNTIARGTLLLMPVFTCTGSGLTKDESGSYVALGAGEQSLATGDGEVLIDAAGLSGDTEAVLNLNYTPSADNATLTISDGSDENTASTTSVATVNVTPQGDEDVETLTINAPTLTVNLAAGTYGTVNAKTATETLKIGEGVTIDELVVNGGNVEISGNVKKITNNVVTTVTVTKDIILTAPIEFANNNIMLTFDLGTYSVKNSNTNGATDGLIINAGASLTITGTTGSLETATGGDGFPVIAQGTVIINGGTFKSYVDANNAGNACIYAKESGNVTVNDGEFFAGKGEYGYDYVLNVKDADRATASITAYGGTFHNFNPAYCKTEGDPTNFLASGCVSLCVDATNNVWKVEKMSDSAIGQAFANGGSFTMIQDVYLGQALTVPAGKTLSLSLAGYDITAPNTDALVAEGTLTITGDESSVVYAGSDPSKTGSVCAVWANGGDVTIDGGHYKVGQDENGKRNDCIYAGYNTENKGGKITINSGKFEFVWGEGSKNYANEYNGDQFLLNCADKAIYTALITVNGGSFKNCAPSYESVTPSGRTENEVQLGTGKAVYKENTEVIAPHGHGTATDAWYEVN